MLRFIWWEIGLLIRGMAFRCYELIVVAAYEELAQFRSTDGREVGSPV